ncbi:DNA phosphorothioation-associated protein 4 [Leptodesmis sichuanensis]|uniref:DNA phosphorothioation-associated protein 4 n=1 Tax=Leptodesmis sichuanensis TaxID=2906798 RepID=UPI001F4579AE|nr:DNA phosphorothioation-associated protein 4 [Leptodesmis sichuanensis]UIE36207.1 DNA phosphorothioation-associated protein 4 [Leptodesmis sichuanensis A121]
MADIRIKVAKDKAKLVKALRTGEGSTGLFQTYVDVMAFAATLGAKRGKYIPVSEASKKDPDPIPQEHFISRGHDQTINLLAITHTKDPKILSNNEELQRKRIEIFESYANGGLEIMQEALRGSSDYTKQIQLLLTAEKNRLNASDELLDLSFL